VFEWEIRCFDSVKTGAFCFVVAINVLLVQCFDPPFAYRPKIMGKFFKSLAAYWKNLIYYKRKLITVSLIFGVQSRNKISR
jgi:hypothetical protein